MDWRVMKRHPLSAERKDITGPAWFTFTLRMKKFGFRPESPIYLHEHMVLVGWQRFRACIETDTEPTFAVKPDDISAEDFVEIMEDIRRHESSEDRQERVARVAERRKGGESFRTIAEQEGISEAQARRDLDKAKSTATPQGALESYPVKVTGKDGKQHPASKPTPRCERCMRLWPNKNVSRPGCVPCHELQQSSRKADEPPEVQETNEVPPEQVVDDDGRAVPEWLLPVFRTVAMFKQFEAYLNKAAKVAKEIENCNALKGKKPLSGKKHYGEMFGQIKNARYRVRDARPVSICGCESGCDKCGGTGFVTFEEIAAREAKT